MPTRSSLLSCEGTAVLITITFVEPEVSAGSKRRILSRRPAAAALSAPPGTRTKELPPNVPERIASPAATAVEPVGEE